MTVKQISVFLENKPGKLLDFTKLLREHDIDMQALALADTADFGIVRVIVSDSYKAACTLKEAGYVYSITPVLAAAIPDKAGSLCEILELLNEKGINLDYTYAFTGRQVNSAYIILRVDKPEEAAALLAESGIHLVSQTELNEL
ncbi:MAG TPA: acetolactate synthase [Candidatus Merdivicinus intestinavium]|nr:acetolactate synthase [Candidatus Merdivicinus intestinavium]